MINTLYRDDDTEIRVEDRTVTYRWKDSETGEFWVFATDFKTPNVAMAMANAIVGAIRDCDNDTAEKLVAAFFPVND